MAVKLRLKRMGAKKRPFYRVVVADSRSPRDGRIVEQIGSYDPMTNPATNKLDKEKVEKWIKEKSPGIFISIGDSYKNCKVAGKY